VATTVVAAQNVCVAAVGTSLASTAAGTGEETEATYASVTLFLTPEDAMRVIQGAKSGVGLLVLRASGDHAANTQPPMISDTLLEQAK